MALSDMQVLHLDRIDVATRPTTLVIKGVLMSALIGGAIAGLGGLLGGIFGGGSKVEPYQPDYHHLKSGIRWRVKDAQLAGIHPLYALGANVGSPAMVGGGGQYDDGLGRGLAAMGQNIGSAIAVLPTAEQRGYAREQMQREREIHRVKMAEHQASIMARMEQSAYARRNLANEAAIHGALGTVTPPTTLSDAEQMEKRWGDAAFIDMLGLRTQDAARNVHRYLKGEYPWKGYWGQTKRWKTRRATGGIPFPKY